MLSIIKKNQQAILELCFGQLDKVGRSLAQHGVSNTINRHHFVGVAYMQKARLNGELARLELKLYHTLKPVKKIQNSIDNRIDQAIDYLPAHLAQKAHCTHNKIKNIVHL